MLETNKAIKMLCKKSKQNKLVRQKIEHVFYLEKVAEDEEGGVVETKDEENLLTSKCNNKFQTSNQWTSFYGCRTYIGGD